MPKYTELINENLFYLQKRGLATTDFDGSLGSLGPALLTAIMRNSYSCPSWTLVTFPAVL
jgi:hypothetical protein